MKKYIISLIIIIGLLFSYDEFLVREFSIKDGFIGGTVNDIFQDHHDRIWFCTSEGISVFDAEEYTNHSQSDLLPSSHTICGIEDSLNRIWLGTKNGLVKIENNNTEVFTINNGLPSNYIKSVVYWNNQLCVGTTQGIAVLLEPENQFRIPVFDFRMNNVSKLYIDNKNKLWIGSSDGLWIVDKTNNVTRIDLPKDYLKIWEIFDIDGTIYVSTESSTENVQNKYKVFKVHYDLRTELLQKDLWFKSAAEIPQYGYIFSSWDRVIVAKQSPFSGLQKIAEFPYAWITVIFHDREGNTWFGSKDRLFFVNDNNIRIRRNDSDKFTLSESSYSTMINGKVVVTGSGQTANGVYLENYKWNEIKNCPTNVTVIQYSKYFGWLVASENGFLGILDTSFWNIEKCKNTNLINNKTVTGIVDCEKSKKVLVTTHMSVFEFDGTKIAEWKIEGSEKINKVTKWKNKIYLGCDDGLFSLDIFKRSLVPILKDTSSFSKIMDMNVTDAGSLVVLEENAGYEFLTEKNYTTIQLPKVKNQKYRSILIIGSDVWINTLASIIHIQDENYTIYDIDCGMVITPSMQWVNGKLWILSYNGVVQIKPKDINSYIPNSIIYSSQNNDEFKILDSLILPINTNNVKFRFSLPSFASIGQHKYKYRLLGLNQEWQYSFDSKLEFLNLETGDYCFQVTGIDRHGKTQNSPTQIHFTVSKSIAMQSIFATLGLFVIIAFFVVVSLKYRKTNLLPPKEEKIEVSLFNSFRVVKDGEIIQNSSWQGKRSKEILFFLILKDFHHKMGVDIEEFQVHFWPDASSQEVLNRKNAAFSRIRKAMRISDQKVIIATDNRYSFDWNDSTISVDVEEFQKYSNNAKNYERLGKRKKMLIEYEKAINLYGNGLTVEFSSHWSDEISEGMRKEVREMVIQTANECFQNRDYYRVIDLAKKMMLWDYLDEIAIEFEINALKRIGKLREAKEKLVKFKKLFLKEIGEESKIEIT